ncbi:sugar kinase [Paracoccaceae bacterium]|nr:sugar kinase [Paracoccaceae bacterium]
MTRLVALGECMVEMAPIATECQFRMGFAGDTLNTAWYLRRLLGPDDQIDYFTAVGTDAVSEHMISFLKHAGIGTKHILRRADKSVGLYMIQLQGGERSFSYWRSDSAARTLSADPQPLQAALEGADFAYFSGITLAILPPEDRIGFLTVLRRFRDSGGCVVFDPNLRPKLWASLQEMTKAVMQAAAVSDIALPSYDDEAQWFGDENPTATLERYLRAQVGCCVVKNGADRLLVAEGVQRFSCDPKPNVRVVDSTAAGDSFNAGFIAARLHGADLRDAVQAGASLAAQVVAKRGALVETALSNETVG